MRTRQKLIDDIQHFLHSSGMDEDVFGWACVKDSTLCARLFSGGDVTTGTMDRIYDCIDANFNLTTKE